jgi:hypothetical protein
MIDFSLTPAQEHLRAKIDAFIRERIIPLEGDPRQSGHGPQDDFRRELNAAARDAGLLAPHVGREWGGLGLDHVSCAVAFEAAGYSLIGPIALNCSAPDEGNMHMLELIGTESDDRLDKKICPWDAIKMYEFDEGVEVSKYFYEAKELDAVKGVYVTTALEKQSLEEKQLELYGVVDAKN